MKVLFSPIGNTDPVSHNRDGALLNICRFYKPDKVYLYLSKDMSEREDEFQLYSKALSLLGNEIDHSIQCESIFRYDLEEVQAFDGFLIDFRQVINQIIEKDNPDEVYLNVSSGTPAMKSSLLLISVLLRDSLEQIEKKGIKVKLTPIQVNAPGPYRNPPRKKEDNDPVYQMDHNQDSKDMSEAKENKDDEALKKVNRTQASIGPQWVLGIRKAIIKRHIRAYDYGAALHVAEETSILSENVEIINLLKGAYRRSKNFFSDLDQYWDDDTLEIIPKWDRHVTYENVKMIIRNAKEMKDTFEYALTVKLKLDRQDYADFLMSLSPLILDIYSMMFNKYRGYDLFDSPYVYHRNGKMKWKKDDKIKQNASDKEYSEYQKLLNYLRNTEMVFNDGYVTNAHIYDIIMGTITDKIKIKSNKRQSTKSLKKISKNLKNIRKVESKLRNTVAHNMVGIDDEYMRKKVGFSSEEIMKTIKYLMKTLYVDNDKLWDNYDVMNDKIITRLEDSAL